MFLFLFGLIFVKEIMEKVKNVVLLSLYLPKTQNDEMILLCYYYTHKHK